MADRIITGFHAVEEFIRSISSKDKQKETGNGSIQIFFADPGPRVKKILSAAKAAGISCTETNKAKLDSMVTGLSEVAREHRGLVLKLTGVSAAQENLVELDTWLKTIPEQATVIILDSVTDPHNVGAILRSCDQLDVNLAILPERRGVKDAVSNEVVSRSSAGASSWIPIASVPNLNRAIQMLKDAGFWIYGADAGGSTITQVKFPARTAIVMGSEGNGISRLLQENCDEIVSIPTCGRLDSLNVSVAAGIILYEIHRQKISCNK